MRRRVLAIAAVAIIGGPRLAGAQLPPIGAAQAAVCKPVERLAVGYSAGDSTFAQGKRVPRTHDALRKLYSKPPGRAPFYPGERIVVGVAGWRLGLATFDGCSLIPEWSGRQRMPDTNAITSFEIVVAKGAPLTLRDARGYRVLNIMAWKTEPRPPAT